MSEIVIISGSPSLSSGSEKVLEYVGKFLEESGLTTTFISVKHVSKEVLFNGQYNHPEIRAIVEKIKNANGIIIGSPVYKGAYSGVLKALIDLLPQDVLEYKPVLPIMTGGSLSHLLALEYSLKPVLATLKGLNLKGLYLRDCQIDKNQDHPILDQEFLQRAKKQLHYFIQIVRNTGVENQENYQIHGGKR